MGTINAAIAVTHDSKNDHRGRTLFETFNDFNEHLFWTSQQKDYQHLLETLDKNHEFVVQETDEDKKKKRLELCQLYESIFLPEESTLSEC